MSTEPIGALAAVNVDPAAAMASLDTSGFLPAADLTATSSASAFDSLVATVESLNARMADGADATRALAAGQMDNLHQVMIAGEQTRLTFDLMMQVRNKVLDAYQELMRMQV